MAGRDRAPAPPAASRRSGGDGGRDSDLGPGGFPGHTILMLRRQR